MTLFMITLFLVNLMGVQWAVFASLKDGRKIEKTLKETLAKSKKLEKANVCMMRIAFEKSAFVG